jgi:hypothetical protein
MNAPVPSLYEWVEVATKKLSLPAKARIKLEINAHFDDSVQKYQKQGLTDSEAQACALVDLGDARVEARRFRKYHLTESEADLFEKKLSSYRLWGRSPWILGILYGSFLPVVFFAYLLLKVLHVPLLLPGIMALILFATLPIACWAVNGGGTRPRLRLLFTIGAIAWIDLLMFLGFYGLSVSWGPLFLVLMGSPVVWWDTLSLWLKIFRMDDVWQEIPPRDTAIKAS